MSKTQHTPGPWEDNGNGLIYGQSSADEAVFVADVCRDPNAYTEQERVNAGLIAAAPKLLAALEAVCLALVPDRVKHGVTHINGECVASKGEHAAWTQAQAAIAAATAT